MEINAISSKLAFKGAEEVDKEQNTHLLNQEAEKDSFQKRTPITTEKLIAAGIGAGAAFDASKKGAVKLADKLEGQIKEFAKDFSLEKVVDNAGEGVKETVTQDVKTGFKGKIAELGNKVKTFRTDKLPNIAKNGLSQSAKNSLKWAGGITAGVVALVTILRDKDKDGRLDIIEAFDALLHPDKVDKE